MINFDEVRALRKAFSTIKDKQQKNRPEDFHEKKERLKRTRAFSVGNRELFRKAIDRIRDNGIEIHIADDGSSANEIIYRYVKDKKTVVKSKSNVTKEIGLSSFLGSHGIEVIETDIGDRILQLIGGNPSHPTGPVAHISAETISERLSDLYGTQIGKNAEDIISFLKNRLRDSIDSADVGITGANALTAEEGSIVLAHNEGNIFEVIRRKQHIVVTSIDKIYPTLEEALNMLKVISFNATGAIVPSFVEIITGVSKTADVEKKFYTGVHSPDNIVLILVDNKRTEILESGPQELLHCIDCGNCLIHCPMYTTVGNYFADGKNLGGKGLACSSVIDREVHGKLELCLTCGKCRDNCPLGIDIPSIIKGLRSENLSTEMYYFLKSHLLWLYYSARLKIGVDN